MGQNHIRIRSVLDIAYIRAELLNKKRFFAPFLSYLPLYSYLGGLITPVPAPVTRSLMEGLKNEVVCQNKSIQDYLPFKPLTYKEAIIRAMSREEQDAIYTRWSDAYPPAHQLALKLHELSEKPRFTSAYSLVTQKEASALFSCFCKVGGKEGWFSSNWLWRLRGIIDKMLLGVGSSRGRRSQTTLKVNDVIDFWRVEDLQKNKRLLLRAEMKMPGKAWLEFQIQDVDYQRKLSIRAYFHTQSLGGKLYWYFFLPFHRFIFNGLIEQIEKRSGSSVVAE
jgi:hypothetical protein